MKGRSRRGTETERRWPLPEDGVLFACRGSPGTGVCPCRRPRYSGLKLRRKRLRDYTARRLPGPAVCRLSEGDQTPEAPFELFRDWQRTQTQSSVTALRGTLRAAGSEYVGFSALLPCARKENCFFS